MIHVCISPDSITPTLTRLCISIFEIFLARPSMATTLLQPLTNNPNDQLAPITISNPKPLRVCFSYAAYAKNLVLHLHDLNIPVEVGISDEEFAALESSFGFRFPPDLRAILREGLPVGHGFPNWRSSSKQQLEILTNLPILGICKEVSRNGFWANYWGERPKDVDQAVKLANGLLKRAPILVPIYRHFYIPTTPYEAGNPIFYVNGTEVRIWSFDIAGFFQRVEFRIDSGEEVLRRPELCDLFAPPAWAAKEARMIEFWTEMAERRGNAVARGRWWSGDLGGCLEEVCCRLRDGGWKEEDVKEMMMMDGCDEVVLETGSDKPFDRECVKWRVRLLSNRLLRAGWSTEDVVESLGFTEDCDLDHESCFDFHHKSSNDQNKISLMDLMGLSVLP